MSGRVVLFKGISDYESLNTMVEEMAAAFRRSGLQALTPNIADDGFAEIMRDLARSGDVDLFVCLNGMGLPAPGSGPGIYGLFDAPVFAPFVDHPLYHLDRLRASVPRLHLSFASPSHVDLAGRLLEARVPIFHLAHGAAAVDPLPWEDRDIGILVSGSPLSETPEARRAAWTDRRLEEIVRRHQAEPRAPLERHVAAALGPARADGQAFVAAFLEADSYLRSRIKVDFMRAILKRDLPVALCGPAQAGTGTPPRNLTFLGPTDAPRTRRLMARARVVLNPLPPYYASHERVFQAAAAGAVAATPRTDLWDAWFADDALLDLPLDGEAAAERLAAALDEDTGLRHTAERGRRTVLAGHTWDHRMAGALAELSGDGLRR